MHQYKPGLLGQRAAQGRNRRLHVHSTDYRVGAKIEHTAPKPLPCRTAGWLVYYGGQPKLKRGGPECAQLLFVFSQFLCAALLLRRDQEQAIDTIYDACERLDLNAQALVDGVYPRRVKRKVPR